MPKRSGLIRLMIATGLIGFAWLMILPWIAQQTRMKSRLDWLEAQRINPNAMYYTELDVMGRILERQRMVSR